MKLWKYGILVAALLIIVVVGHYAIRVHHYASVTVPNAYAVWWVASMVIEHLDANDGAWPKEWDDLRDDYDVCVESSGQSWTFEELRDRVKVDWSADPVQLATVPPNAEEPPFHAIQVRDGANVHWGGREPNRMILDYLHEQQPPQSIDE